MFFAHYYGIQSFIENLFHLKAIKRDFVLFVKGPSEKNVFYDWLKARKIFKNSLSSIQSNCLEIQ